MRWPAVLLAGCLAGCGAIDTHHARDPYGAMVGMSAPDLLACAGMPDHVQQTGPDTAIVQWDYRSQVAALKLTVAVFGTLEVGGAESCKLVATVLRDGTVADVAFPGSQTTLTGGPHAGCGVLIDECLAHPSSTGLPADYDSFSYLIPKGAK